MAKATEEYQRTTQQRRGKEKMKVRGRPGSTKNNKNHGMKRMPDRRTREKK